jgi:hypothetical protein
MCVCACVWICVRGFACAYVCLCMDRFWRGSPTRNGGGGGGSGSQDLDAGHQVFTERHTLEARL